MFAMIPAGGTEFIQDDGFKRTGRSSVPLDDCGQILPFGSWTHGNLPSSKGYSSGNMNYESTIYPRIQLGNI